MQHRFPQLRHIQLARLLQEYIENENSRLEREHQFWAKEIIVRMEYKYCPNLSIIDTPGEAPACGVCPCSREQMCSLTQHCRRSHTLKLVVTVAAACATLQA